MCIQCYKHLNYDDGKVGDGHRDNLGEAAITSDAIPPDFSVEQHKDHMGKLSQGRGVPIGWLVDFTIKNDCWEKKTQDVCKDYIWPATAARRCRYVELDHMQDIVGPAKTFISHCRAGKWGDLVAAVCDGDENTCGSTSLPAVNGLALIRTSTLNTRFPIARRSS